MSACVGYKPTNVGRKVIEKEEEEVIEEYDSDFDSNLSLPQLSKNEEMKTREMADR